MSDPLENFTYAVDEQLLVLDTDLRVIDASPAYYKTFKVEPNETLERQLEKLGSGQWNAPALLERLKKLAAADGEFDAFKVQHNFPSLGSKTMSLSARRLSGKGNGTASILLTINDVTEQKSTKAELIQHVPPVHN
jgi:hypothetical protein